jgi:hypothetical protein
VLDIRHISGSEAGGKKLAVSLVAGKALSKMASLNNLNLERGNYA